MKLLSRLVALHLAALPLAALAIAAAGPAQAEGQVSIAQQFGTTYLPLHVMRDQKLIEKHGTAAGIDIAVDWKRLTGGAAINEAIVSGAVDFAAGGVPPLLLLWDRTRKNVGVKAVGALGEQSNVLVTNKPGINSITDFGPDDRIAMPAAIVSLQGRILQMALEKKLGQGKHTLLDRNMIGLPHADSMTAILSGSTEVTGYFSNPPFQQQIVKDPKVRTILNSEEVFDGPATGVLFYATTRFKKENPKTFGAVFAALNEATEWIAANKGEAARTYVRVEQSKLDPAFIEEVISGDDVKFTTTPAKTYTFADFLYRIGSIKTMPDSWKDYTFEELHDRPGS